jgi:hypothetical protein
LRISSTDSTGLARRPSIWNSGSVTPESLLALSP